MLTTVYRTIYTEANNQRWIARQSPRIAIQITYAARRSPGIARRSPLGEFQVVGGLQVDKMAAPQGTSVTLAKVEDVEGGGVVISSCQV